MSTFTSQDIAQFKNTIQLLWSQGLKDNARSMEIKAREQGILSMGSCHTEEQLEKFITCDPSMIELKNTVRSLAGIIDPVLIEGPTGTGKELIANALHGSRTGKFLAINCPALSVDLMESELFGHVKGAFTGALNDRIGKFQAAANGTLFIDEIGDMPASMQAAILRTLQERKITRVGSNEEIDLVNVRIVCATNKNPMQVLREDLYHRIATFHLRTQSLSLRASGDIDLIIKRFDKTGKFDVKQAGSLNGNVRELLSMIRRFEVLGKYN